MAKKRKNDSSKELVSEVTKQEQKRQSPPEEYESDDAEEVEVEVEEEVEEDESEEQEEPEEEENKSSSEESEEDNEYSKLETVKKLLEPFSKDQLIGILKEAAIANPGLIDDIVKSSESDPVHRKIFVHGLGWDTTNETLVSAFKQFGQIDECNMVTDKVTGRSKGYGFVLFKTRAGAQKALKEPQKKIGNRMAACQLASAGPVQNQPGSDVASRKMYVANVGPQLSVEKLKAFFAKFGEIEDGPLGLDKITGKFRGYAIIIYRTLDGIKNALEEPVKIFEGCSLQCSKAAEGRTAKTTTPGQVVGGSVPNVNLLANAAGVPNNLQLPTFPMGFNQGMLAQNLNPGAVLWGQNPAFGILNPVLGMGNGAILNQTGLSPSFAGGVSQSLNRVGNTPQLGLGAAFGAQPSVNTISPNVISTYGSQAVLQGLGAYQNSQLGQSTSSGVPATRPQTSIGSGGTLSSYFGR